MSAIDDGGPAFPHERQIRCNGEVVDHDNMPGMSLRDYATIEFAKALCWRFVTEDDGVLAGECLIVAAEFADAFIAARKEKP